MNIYWSMNGNHTVCKFEQKLSDGGFLGGFHVISSIGMNKLLQKKITDISYREKSSIDENDKFIGTLNQITNIKLDKLNNSIAVNYVNKKVKTFVSTQLLPIRIGDYEVKIDKDKIAVGCVTVKKETLKIILKRMDILKST